MHPISRRQALRRMGYLGGALTLPSAMPFADFPAPREKLDDTPVLASGEEGLIDMQIIAAIKRSIERGQAVPVEYGE